MIRHLTEPRLQNIPGFYENEILSEAKDLKIENHEKPFLLFLPLLLSFAVSRLTSHLLP